MKHIKSLLLGLTAACTVFAVGCGGGDTQSDHDHEHGDDHSHGETNAPAGGGTNAPMGDVSAAKPYLLDVCIVSGEELGSMGDPIVKVHAGQTVKFCCDSCLPDFDADPAKFIAKVNVVPPVQ